MRGAPLGCGPVTDLDSIFKAYDVRGVVPDQFDERIARAVGVAFARFVSQGDAPASTVLVARDMRPSGVGIPPRTTTKS